MHSLVSLPHVGQWRWSPGKRSWLWRTEPWLCAPPCTLPSGCNGRVYNMVAWTTVVAVAGLSVLMVLTTILSGLGIHILGL